MKIKQFIAAAIVAIIPFGTIGCVTQTTIAELTTTLGTAAASIAVIEGNSTLAQQLQTDTKAAVAAVNGWKPGTPADEVIEALGIVEDDLNLIPAVGPYVPLVDVCIGTVQEILALLPAPAATPAVQSKAKVARRTPVLTLPAPKNAKQFDKQWDAILKLNPSINLPKL